MVPLQVKGNTQSCPVAGPEDTEHVEGAAVVMVVVGVVVVVVVVVLVTGFFTDWLHIARKGTPLLGAKPVSLLNQTFRPKLKQ